MDPDKASIDHIGWDLWRATQAWKSELTQHVVSRGIAWYGEARAGLVRHIGANGISQSGLASVTGVTKQAIQQQLDELARDGIIIRRDDPADKRKKIVELTPAGTHALKVVNEVKQDIEARYVQLVGQESFSALRDTLAVIIDEQSDTT